MEMDLMVNTVLTAMIPGTAGDFIVAMLKSLTAEERNDAIQLILTQYCGGCGKPQKGKPCTCRKKEV